MRQYPLPFIQISHHIEHIVEYLLLFLRQGIPAIEYTLLFCSQGDNDAFFLENVCKKVTLCSDKSDRSVTVEYPDMTYLGVWHAPKTEAPYVCIEPWTSLPDYDREPGDFATKRDMMFLPAGESYTNTFTITVS